MTLQADQGEPIKPDRQINSNASSAGGKLPLALLEQPGFDIRKNQQGPLRVRPNMDGGHILGSGASNYMGNCSSSSTSRTVEITADIHFLRLLLIALSDPLLSCSK